MSMAPHAQFCAACRGRDLTYDDFRDTARPRGLDGTTAPRSWAGVVANAPLKLPTGVRAALTMTISLDIESSSAAGWGVMQIG
jgi:hypothetical protein